MMIVVGVLEYTWGYLVWRYHVNIWVGTPSRFERVERLVEHAGSIPARLTTQIFDY